eukprot:scaffold197476_cov66-Cyclotella_meneghiniana.AAC.1
MVVATVEKRKRSHAKKKEGPGEGPRDAKDRRMRIVLPQNLLGKMPGHVDHERDSTPIHSFFVN